MTSSLPYELYARMADNYVRPSEREVNEYHLCSQDSEALSISNDVLRRVVGGRSGIFDFVANISRLEGFNASECMVRAAPRLAAEEQDREYAAYVLRNFHRVASELIELRAKSDEGGI